MIEEVQEALSRFGIAARRHWHALLIAGQDGDGCRACDRQLRIEMWEKITAS